MRSRADINNRANQMNPNNPAYWSGRGAPEPAAPPPSLGGSATPEQTLPSAPAAPPQAPVPAPPSTTR